MGIIHSLDVSTIEAVAHPSNFLLISLPQEKRPIRILEELLYNLDEVNLSGTRGGLSH